MATRRSSGPVLRSHSPSGRFYSGSKSSSSSFASSTTSSFSSRSFLRSSSPTRVNVNVNGVFSNSPSVRFNSGSVSPNRSISAQSVQRQPAKKACMCSPTNHPGSFRCSLHKNAANRGGNGNGSVSVLPYQSNRLYARRSAMTNSLVRIGTVEGDLVKRALASLIRPSSHQQKRRVDFRPRKSRLSSMSMAN